MEGKRRRPGLTSFLGNMEDIGCFSQLAVENLFFLLHWRCSIFILGPDNLGLNKCLSPIVLNQIISRCLRKNEIVMCRQLFLLL